MQAPQTEKQVPDPAATVPLSDFVLIHLRFLQLIGLCPISLRGGGSIDSNAKNQTSNSDRYHKLWIYFHMGALIGMHCIVAINRYRFFENHDNFSRFIDMLKLIGTMLAHFITLCETLLRRHQLHQFLQIYARLHRSWSSLTCKREAYIYRRLIFNLILYLAIMLAVEIAYFIDIHSFLLWKLFYLCFLPSVLVGRFRMLQFIFYLELVRLEVDELNARIVRLVALNQLLQTDNEFFVTTHIEKYFCVQMHKLMLHYNAIYKMTELLKHCTSWSMVTVYVTAYFKLLTDCYWAIWVVYTGETFANVLKIRGFPTAMNIFQLLWMSRNCMYSTKYLAHNIHKFRHSVDSLKMATLVQNFSLQLIHQKIVFDAHGFFVINCNIARTILGSLATYMLFFIQFMPKFKNI